MMILLMIEEMLIDLGGATVTSAASTTIVQRHARSRHHRSWSRLPTHGYYGRIEYWARSRLASFANASPAIIFLKCMVC